MRRVRSKKTLIERFSEETRREDEKPPLLWEERGQQTRHMTQFFKTAEHRKRQILEKMLMD